MTRARVTSSWLALREAADAAARATELIDEVRRGLPRNRPIVIHDLACGTGSVLRWLAPKLPGPQHWVNHDADSDLLSELHNRPVVVAADGSPVTTQVHSADVTRLHDADVRNAALITSSALLDLLSKEELSRFVRTSAAAQCPVLLTLTVTGNVRIEPAHPLDQRIATAFNDHQRRDVDGRRLLGPDASQVAARMFAALGRDVIMRPSPWRLCSTSRELAAEWLHGWLAAACAQDPQLALAADRYAEQRLSDAAAGRLRITVGHADLLVRAALPLDRR